MYNNTNNDQSLLISCFMLVLAIRSALVLNDFLTTAVFTFLGFSVLLNWHNKNQER